MNDGIIYIATNLKNGKQYVGQTTRSLRERIIGHKCDALKMKRNVPFILSIKKYGLDNFKWTSFSCPEEDLDWTETFLIKELNTLVPNGYNLETGGNKNKHHHELSKQKMSENHWDCSGEKHPMFGTHRVGNKNPMYGKKHTLGAITKQKQFAINRFKNEKNRKILSSIRIINKIAVGEKNPAAKLTETDVLKIKNYLKENKLTINEIAKKFQINRRTVSAIKHNKIWKYLGG